MCKKTILLLLVFLFIATFATIVPVKNVQAAEQTKDITFEDVNMYDSVKTALSDRAFTSNDGTKTITMSTDIINSVDYIYLTGVKQISSIKGIENFTNLSSFYFNYTGSENDILDISPLGKLTKLLKIDIAHITIKDISSLQNCNRLENLRLRRTNIID